MQWTTVTIDWPWLIVAAYIVFLVAKPKAATRVTREVLTWLFLGLRAVWPF